MYGDMVASTHHVVGLYIEGDGESPEFFCNLCSQRITIQSWLVELYKP